MEASSRRTQARRVSASAKPRTAPLDTADCVRPRLLLITPDFPPSRGGIQTLMAHLARGMRGFEVQVVTVHAPGEGRLETQSASRTTRRRRVLALNARALSRALRFEPHVLLSAHVVASPATVLLRRMLGVRTAQYFHAIEIVGKPKLSAFAATRCDLVIAVSAFTASLLAATGATPANVQVIPPGVDLPTDASAIHADRPTVVTVAKLDYSYKGHDVLIQALAKLRAVVPDVDWVVVGDGRLRPALEAMASAAGLSDSARFVGEVPDVLRDYWLRRADVFAMPSRLPGEGFGIAYLEANAYGKPVVGANVGGPREAIEDGVSGVLVDPNDPGAVADALARLLGDPAYAQRLGSGGARRAQRFAWPLIVARVEAALMALVVGA
jgi:phosphatidyl-myo-inositol dimannoside synthase